MRKKYTAEQVSEGCVDIEIDGYFCCKCNQWHPTLIWHEKYMDLLDEEDHANSLRDAFMCFGSSISDEEIRCRYEDWLRIHQLIRSERIGSCAVCSAPAWYMDAVTHAYVCSQACRAQQGWKSPSFPYKKAE